MTAYALPEAAAAHLRAFARSLPADPEAAVRAARAQGVPVAVLDADVAPALSAAEPWCAAAESDRSRAQRIAAAFEGAERVLAGVPGVAVADPLLGRGWSSDVDVFAAPEAVARAGEALRAAGAVPVDGLLATVRGRGMRHGEPRHFALVGDDGVIAAVELLTELWTRGAPAAPAVARAVSGDTGLPRLAERDVALRRVGKLAAARAPTVRGLLELTVLLERGATLPRGLAGGVLRRHRELEAALAGPGIVTAAAAAAPRRPGAAAAWLAARARALRRATRSRGQLRVAFCGVDGAGKSTQVAALEGNLKRAGVPAKWTWTRLGSRASAPVAGLARFAQRMLPHGTHSYESVREQAGRSDPERSVPVEPPLTRRGPIGWAWALAVTIDYLVRARTAVRRAPGVVLVLDRALPDALVGLEDNYGVALELRTQHRLLERFTPRPHIVFYLRLAGAAAKARKDDSFTAAELEAHRAHYEELLQTLDNVFTLDAERPRDELALEVLRRVSASVSSAGA